LLKGQEIVRLVNCNPPIFAVFVHAMRAARCARAFTLTVGQEFY
jgi:hypothetical protein